MRYTRADWVDLPMQAAMAARRWQIPAMAEHRRVAAQPALRPPEIPPVSPTPV